MGRLKLIVLFAALLAIVGLGVYLPDVFSDDPGATPASTRSGGPTATLSTGVLDYDGAALPNIDLETAAELSKGELVDLVGAAVVSILTETVNQRWFFQATPQTGAGTGVLISPDGYIVTNNHVVSGAGKITVTLSDGRTFTPVSVATDAQTDLAVLKIEAGDLPYLHFLSDSLEQLRELDTVVAVGNALALPGGPTWTQGVVSNLGRTIDLEDGTVLYDLIQTDAAVNPGNSGGPLVNMAGQIVGINVAIASNAENIGFAISTNTAIPVIASLVENGQVHRPWLGVTMLTVNSIVKSQYGLSVDEGVLVYQVSTGGPADRAGLKPGDVIRAIDGQRTATSESLRTALQARPPGDEVEIEYFRGSEHRTIGVVLGTT